MRADRARAWLGGYARQGAQYAPVIRVEATGDDVVTWGEFVELGYLREYVDDDIDAFERASDHLRWLLVEWYPPLWRGMRPLIEGRLADAAEFEDRARQIGRRAGSGNAGILTDVLRLQRLMERSRGATAASPHRCRGRYV